MKFWKLLLAALALLSGFTVNAKSKVKHTTCDVNGASVVAAGVMVRAQQDYGADGLTVQDVLENSEAFFYIFGLTNPQRGLVANVPYSGYIKILKQDCFYTSGNWGTGDSRIFLPKDAVSVDSAQASASNEEASLY